MHKVALVLLSGLTLMLAGCASTSAATDGSTSFTAAAPDPMSISKSTFKGTWPLTVNSATIVCGSKSQESVGVESGGTTYALNGPGKTFEQWPWVDAIWAANPDPNSGPKITLGDLTDYARAKCGLT